MVPSDATRSQGGTGRVGGVEALTAAFTPDPYLSSTLSYIAIRGLQASGLVTCAKHYFLYEQEPVCDGPVDEYGGRTGCVDIHSMVDGGWGGCSDPRQNHQRTLPPELRRGGEGGHWGGDVVGEEETLTQLSSYNRINDTPACQSDDAMNRILKTELNFQGLWVSRR